MNGNGELTGTETLFLRKLRSSYEILTDERNSYVLLQRHGNVNLETRREGDGSPVAWLGRNFGLLLIPDGLEFF